MTTIYNANKQFFLKGGRGEGLLKQYEFYQVFRRINNEGITNVFENPWSIILEFEVVFRFWGKLFASPKTGKYIYIFLKKVHTHLFVNIGFNLLIKGQLVCL
jgi:hypothetical protein